MPEGGVGMTSVVLEVAGASARRWPSALADLSSGRNDPELLVSLFIFIDSFELVFGETDWDITREGICGYLAKHFIHPNGTFLEPGVDDESHRWGNRGALLADYRRLKHRMSAIEPVINIIFQQRRARNSQPAKEIEMPKISNNKAEL
jgi:hypothetical protein